MAKKRQNNLQSLWIIILVVLAVLVAIFVLLKSKVPQTPQPETGYQRNQSPAYQFNNVQNGTITKEEAIAKVKELPEVTDYMTRVPNGLVAVNGEEDNAYMVQVYEFKDGHTASFNWYKVDKTTGETKSEF